MRKIASYTIVAIVLSISPTPSFADDTRVQNKATATAQKTAEQQSFWRSVYNIYKYGATDPEVGKRNAKAKPPVGSLGIRG